MFIKNEFEIVTFRNFGLCPGDCVFYFHSQYFDTLYVHGFALLWYINPLISQYSWCLINTRVFFLHIPVCCDPVFNKLIGGSLTQICKKIDLMNFHHFFRYQVRLCVHFVHVAPEGAEPVRFSVEESERVHEVYYFWI